MVLPHCVCKCQPSQQQVYIAQDTFICMLVRNCGVIGLLNRMDTFFIWDVTASKYDPRISRGVAFIWHSLMHWGQVCVCVCVCVCVWWWCWWGPF